MPALSSENSRDSGIEILEDSGIRGLAGIVASDGMERVITIAGGGLAGLSRDRVATEGDPVILHEAGGYPRHRGAGVH
jgi:hypothetical protein